MSNRLPSWAVQFLLAVTLLTLGLPVALIAPAPVTVVGTISIVAAVVLTVAGAWGWIDSRRATAQHEPE